MTHRKLTLFGPNKRPPRSRPSSCSLCAILWLLILSIYIHANHCWPQLGDDHSSFAARPLIENHEDKLSESSAAGSQIEAKFKQTNHSQAAAAALNGTSLSEHELAEAEEFNGQPLQQQQQQQSLAGGSSSIGEESMKFPLYMRIFATLFCLLIFAVGVCGNLLVPLVVIKTKYLRNSTNLFLINLSVADLLVLIVCMPTVLIELHSRPETWLLGEPMCKLSNYVEMLAANGSIFTILAISFERYYAICKPLKAGYKCTRLRATIIICFVWLLASILTSPILIMAKSSQTTYIDGSLVYNCILETDTYWHKMYVFVSMFAFFCLPLLVLMLVYWLIGRRLIRENLAMSGRVASSHCSSSTATNSTGLTNLQHSLRTEPIDQRPAAAAGISWYQSGKRVSLRKAASLKSMSTFFASFGQHPHHHHHGHHQHNHHRHHHHHNDHHHHHYDQRSNYHPTIVAAPVNGQQQQQQHRGRQVTLRASKAFSLDLNRNGRQLINSAAVGRAVIGDSKAISQEATLLRDHRRRFSCSSSSSSSTLNRCRCCGCGCSCSPGGGGGGVAADGCGCTSSSLNGLSSCRSKPMGSSGGGQRKKPSEYRLIPAILDRLLPHLVLPSSWLSRSSAAQYEAGAKADQAADAQLEPNDDDAAAAAAARKRNDCNNNNSSSSCGNGGTNVSYGNATDGNGLSFHPKRADGFMIMNSISETAPMPPASSSSDNDGDYGGDDDGGDDGGASGQLASPPVAGRRPAQDQRSQTSDPSRLAKESYANEEDQEQEEEGEQLDSSGGGGGHSCGRTGVNGSPKMEEFRSSLWLTGSLSSSSSSRYCSVHELRPDEGQQQHQDDGALIAIVPRLEASPAAAELEPPPLLKSQQKDNDGGQQSRDFVAGVEGVHDKWAATQEGRSRAQWRRPAAADNDGPAECSRRQLAKKSAHFGTTCVAAANSTAGDGGGRISKIDGHHDNDGQDDGGASEHGNYRGGARARKRANMATKIAPARRQHQFAAAAAAAAVGCCSSPVDCEHRAPTASASVVVVVGGGGVSAGSGNSSGSSSAYASQSCSASSASSSSSAGSSKSPSPDSMLSGLTFGRQQQQQQQQQRQRQHQSDQVIENSLDSDKAAAAAAGEQPARAASGGPRDPIARVGPASSEASSRPSSVALSLAASASSFNCNNNNNNNNSGSSTTDRDSASTKSATTILLADGGGGGGAGKSSHHDSQEAACKPPATESAPAMPAMMTSRKKVSSDQCDITEKFSRTNSLVLDGEPPSSSCAKARIGARVGCSLKRFRHRSISKPIVCSQLDNGSHLSELLIVQDLSKKQQMDSRRQVVIMLAFVVACFFLLFFPYRVFTIWLILSTEAQVQSLGMETYYNLTYFSRILIYLHSAINPIAYNLISTKFRRAFMSILLCRGSSTRRHFTTDHQKRLNNLHNTNANANLTNHHHHQHHDLLRKGSNRDQEFVCPASPNRRQATIR